MPAAEARVPTPNAHRYLTRLCRHAGKMHSDLRHRPRGHQDGSTPPVIRHAECSGPDGSVVLDHGQCTLHADDGMLILRAQADSEGALTRIQDLIARRLESFGRREHLTVTWHQAQPHGEPPAADGQVPDPQMKARPQHNN